jgi:hypothetical protein
MRADNDVGNALVETAGTDSTRSASPPCNVDMQQVEPRVVTD